MLDPDNFEPSTLTILSISEKIYFEGLTKLTLNGLRFKSRSLTLFDRRMDIKQKFRVCQTPKSPSKISDDTRHGKSLSIYKDQLCL